MDLHGLAQHLNQDADRAVVLIDGGSGSGKTTLAERLEAVWPGDVHLVSLDDLYAGWSGMATGSLAVGSQLLRPVDPGYWRWDWSRSAFTEWVEVDPQRPLIVEGCGALTPTNRQLATFGIWCELDPDERRRRALSREPGFASHWDEWAAQEAEHWSINRPWELADLVVPGG